MSKLLRDFLEEFLKTATCEETRGMVGQDYIRCGKPAVAIVKTKDTNPYAMCLMDAYHNIANRGAILVFTTDETLRGESHADKSRKDR